jgi:predicted secreted protein
MAVRRVSEGNVSIGAFIVMFSASWWVIFYIALPIGNKTGRVEKGHADSAPDNPHLWLKVLITTVIALLITVGFLHLVEIKVIDLEGYLTGYSEKLFNF